MDQQQRIRVMIVDDHAVLRAGLRLFLNSFDDLELVGEATDGTEALAVCAEAHPDVILMDMVMPNLDGAETTRLILARHPHVRVIILTSFQEEDQVAQAVQAGAVGYLLKNASADELAYAIREAYAGRFSLGASAAGVLIDALRQRGTGQLDYGLTPREKEVLGLLVQGMSNAQIAEHLTVSRATAKFHVSCILLKLRVASRTEAVSVALQRGLIP